MQKEALNTHTKGEERHRDGHKIVGLLMAGVGFFWLAKKAGWIPVAAGGSGIFWPVVTIGAGLFMILAPRHRRKRNRELTR